MSAPGLPELLAKIEQASADCREVIRATHEASRDLKTLLREAREIIAEVEQAAKATVEQRVEAAVQQGLEEYTSTIGAQMSKAAAKVNAEFAEQANLCLYGNKQGRGVSILEQVAIKLREADRRMGHVLNGDES